MSPRGPSLRLLSSPSTDTTGAASVCRNCHGTCFKQAPSGRCSVTLDWPNTPSLAEGATSSSCWARSAWTAVSVSELQNHAVSLIASIQSRLSLRCSKTAHTLPTTPALLLPSLEKKVLRSSTQDHHPVRSQSSRSLPRHARMLLKLGPVGRVVGLARRPALSPPALLLQRRN